MPWMEGMELWKPTHIQFDNAGEVTNGTYFLFPPLAISRFSSARGLVNQPQ